MAKVKNKRSLIIAAIVLGVLLVGIMTIAILNGLKGKEADPYAQKDQGTSSTSSDDTSTPKDEDTASKPTTPDTETPPKDDAANLDPATIGTIDIEPMGLTVSYVKGVGGFSYNVGRTADGRRFVEFSNEGLVGTKCTDDDGVFVSILQSPNDSDKATVSVTKDVEGTTYGLSIASNTCTGDAALLAKYQDSFKSAFGLLKKTN